MDYQSRPDQHLTWRDTVEHRLGAVQQSVAQAHQQHDHLRDDFKGLESSVDRVRSELSAQIASGLGALRADVLALRISTPAGPVSAAAVDWRMVAIGAAVLAGLLVGAGIAIGKAWQQDDVKAIAKQVLS